MAKDANWHPYDGALHNAGMRNPARSAAKAMLRPEIV